MSEFLQGNGHPHVKSNTPLQVEVSVPKMRPCKLRATFSSKKILPPLKHRPSYGLAKGKQIQEKGVWLASKSARKYGESSGGRFSDR